MRSKIAQKSPKIWPPVGLSFVDYPGAKKPFSTRWREHGAKRSQSFATAKARDEFAEGWKQLRTRYGQGAAVKTAQEVLVWEEFRRITGNAGIIEVAQFWAKHRGRLAGALSLADAIARYIAAQDGRTLARDTITHRDLHLKRLRESLGDGKSISEITTDGIRKWLAGIGMSAYSQKHHRANANKLFEWLVMERMLDRNPVAPLPVPEDAAGEINLLSVEQAQKLFVANHRHRSIGRLALEAFAGLRTSSAARLVWDDIKFEQLGIELPAQPPPRIRTPAPVKSAL